MPIDTITGENVREFLGKKAKYEQYFGQLINDEDGFGIEDPKHGRLNLRQGDKVRVYNPGPARAAKPQDHVYQVGDVGAAQPRRVSA